MSTQHDRPLDEQGTVDGDTMRRTILLYPSGVLFEPYAPNPEHLDIRCLAHGLAGTNRFNGHTRDLMNVAHHSVIVSLRIEAVEGRAGRVDAFDAYHNKEHWLSKKRGGSPLKGLLHDAPEGVSGFGDVAGPVKHDPRIKDIIAAVEDTISDGVSIKYGLSQGFASEPIVKAADHWSYHWENRDLRGIAPPPGVVLPSKKLVPLDRDQARSAFLCRFVELTGNEIGEVPWSNDTSAWCQYLAETRTLVDVG